MTINLSALQKQRRDTAANWTAENPTLLAGEIGIESDTGYWKVGDGATAWTSLAYVSGLGGKVGLPDGTAAAPALFFADDTNTGIYSPGADQLALSTNGTGRLFVGANGNVGVGTAGPVYALDVAGSIQIANNHSLRAYNAAGSSSIRLLTFGADDNLYLGGNEANANQNTILRTNSSERLRITSAGLVGIGTSAPADVLHINGGQIRIQSNVPQILFRSADGSSNQYYIGANISDAVDGGFIIGEGPGITGGTPRIAITGTGNVGIGTGSPSGELHIAGSDANTDIFVTEGSTNTDARIRNSNGVLLLDADVNNENGGSAIVLGVDGTERARIDSVGRLLVGTSSARTTSTVNWLSQIEGGAFTGLGITTNANSTAGAYLSLAKTRGTTIGSSTIVNNNDVLGAILFSGADGVDANTQAATILCNVDGTPGANDMPGRLVFSTTADGASSPTERMRITSAGNVGIGTASPSQLLHVYSTSSADNVAKIESTDSNAFLQFADSSTTGQVRVGAVGSNLAFWGGSFTSEAARIDSSGRLLVGTSSAFDELSPLEVVGAGAQYGLFATNSTGVNIVLSKARGTLASPSVVANGDTLGQIAFKGYSTTAAAYRNAAYIAAQVDGEPDTGGDASDMPGRLVFSVTADGASSPTEALRISNNRAITVSDGGNVVLGTTTGTKIGTATTQKLGFYNATPVVQPAAVADATDAATVITQLNDLLAKLRTLGIIAT